MVLKIVHVGQFSLGYTRTSPDSHEQDTDGDLSCFESLGLSSLKGIAGEWRGEGFHGRTGHGKERQNESDLKMGTDMKDGV